ncbi:methyltransferase domain-containing protein [Patescibacteria group bacterium]|nr:methyltransferase domain-containing protein [Patescibacteria group bacterium]MBU1895892.1 methyltransferase domain-containing protein [Patescibacteria group bacterium]
MQENIPQSLDKARTYEKQGVVWIAWPEKMGELAVDEANYHDEFYEDAKDVHQLDAWRNIFYHNIIQNKLNEQPENSRILEVGAGSGTDAIKLKEKYKLTLTDISPKTLERTAKKLGHINIDYIAADGENLPFQDAYFDGLYMVATWHHFEDPKKALAEARRVLKPGGLLVIGVEPNSLYFGAIKNLRPILCKAVGTKTTDGSHADAEMSGFSYRDITKLFNVEWKDLEIKPMWLIAGWMHYFLEFIYRVFKMKKRIKLPLLIEKFIVGLDEILFKIPGFKHLGWHWVINTRNK